MGLLGFGKKKDTTSKENSREQNSKKSDTQTADRDNRQDETVLQQDLSHKDRPGMVFLIHLFMEEYCDLPDKDVMTDVMSKHLGDVECFNHSENMAGFAPKKYKVAFKEGTVPPQLMVMKCISTENLKLDAITRSQMWDCPDSSEILDQCKYQVVATDMLAAGLPYKERAEMLMDYAEALVEMFPSCRAVLFGTSGKLFRREQVLNHQVPREQRFLHFAVNIRLFNIQGTGDKVMDTLGMSTLFMPDLQYHFHGLDPNAVAQHARNVLLYLFENDCPIKSGDPIDGLMEGQISRQVQWQCRFEDALIQPARQVIDIHTGEYAAGRREW